MGKRGIMTIQEITQLRNQEMSGKLRMPEQAITFNPKKISEVNQAVEFLTKAKSSCFSLLVKMIIKTFDGIKDIKGVGSKENPYVISTDLGCGSFYSSRECFVEEDYPKDYAVNECFNNCYLAVTKGRVENCQILSGIAYRGSKPFLHSTLKIGNKILDFSYDFCMDENLYMKLFNFEVLSTLDSQTLIDNYPIIRKHQRFLSYKGFSTMYVNFAFEDLIDYLKDKNRREKEKVEIALD